MADELHPRLFKAVPSAAPKQRPKLTPTPTRLMFIKPLNQECHNFLDPITGHGTGRANRPSSQTEAVPLKADTTYMWKPVWSRGSEHAEDLELHCIGPAASAADEHVVGEPLVRPVLHLEPRRSAEVVEQGVDDL